MVTEERIGGERGALPAALDGTPVRRRPRARLRSLPTTLEAFRLASASLRANKLRSGLTLVGIVVGLGISAGARLDPIEALRYE